MVASLFMNHLPGTGRLLFGLIPMQNLQAMNLIDTRISKRIFLLIVIMPAKLFKMQSTISAKQRDILFGMAWIELPRYGQMRR